MPLSPFLRVTALPCDTGGHNEKTYTVRGVKPYRDNEIMRVVGDATKLAKKTGWTPNTTLEEGLKQTYMWYNKLYNEVFNET